MKDSYLKTLKRLFVYIILLSSFLNNACLNRGQPVVNEISSNQLVGNWKITDESIKFLISENAFVKNQKTTLLLLENGEFELKNMPDCWTDNFGECHGNTTSFNGKWSINQRATLDNWLRLKENSHVYIIPITQRNNIIQLVFTFGDPDRGREIFLTKE